MQVIAIIVARGTLRRRVRRRSGGSRRRGLQRCRLGPLPLISCAQPTIRRRARQKLRERHVEALAEVRRRGKDARRRRAERRRVHELAAERARRNRLGRVGNNIDAAHRPGPPDAVQLEGSKRHTLGTDAVVQIASLNIRADDVFAAQPRPQRHHGDDAEGRLRRRRERATDAVC